MKIRWLPIIAALLLIGASAGLIAGGRAHEHQSVNATGKARQDDACGQTVVQGEPCISADPQAARTKTGDYLADASEIRAFDDARELIKRGAPAASGDNPFSLPADVDPGTVLDCLSEHENVRAQLKMTASEATFSLRLPDNQIVVCKAKPTFVDGRKAANPHYRANFSLSRCAPELPAALAAKLRVQVEYRMTLFDGKSTLDWIAQSIAKDCGIRVNNFQDYFSRNEKR